MSAPGFAQALLSPRSIALIGASGDATKNTARPQRFLRKHGYRGALYPINKTRSEILGERAYPSLAAVQAPIDHAFVMVPTRDVLDAIEQCGACHVPIATVYTDGFADVGAAGTALQAQLAARARQLGVRLVGPNCIGLLNVHTGMALSVNAVLETDHITPGPLSIVSQSGSMMGALLARGLARNFGFAKLVSVGNEADVSVGEIVDALVDDPRTETIALFMESMRNADQLAGAAGRAYAAGKPVVVYKLGRSAVGEALAVTHTGALAGADDIADAFFQRHGIVRVDMLETLLEIGPLLRGRRPPRAGGLTRAVPRVATVTTTGGGAATVADRLGTLGLDVAAPDDAFVARMAAAEVAVRKSPIIDLTLAATSAKYRAVLDGLLDWDGCDAVLAVVGSSAQFHPQLAVKPIVEARRAAKPLAAFLAPEATRSLAWLAEQGVPAFRTPEACADALRAFFAWHQPAQTAPHADGSSLHDAAHAVSSIAGGSASELDALRVFAALGIECARTVRARAPDFAHGLPYPVAVKICSADIAHKTDIGGVALDVGDAHECRNTATLIIERARTAMPAARVDGVVVQPMTRGLGEAIVGYRQDPQVGPVVLVGAGGSLAEALRDYAVALAPVALDEALEMIARVKGFALLRGYRNTPRGDLNALAQAVVAMSRLALLEGQPVAEAEINPLVVRGDGQGVVAVDGLLVMKGARA